MDFRPLAYRGRIFLRNNRERVPDVEIIKELVGFKNYQGQFVKRRAKAFHRFADKNNLSHQDDLSVATIHIGEAVNND